MTPVTMGEYPDPPERTSDDPDVLTGLPDEEPEPAPLGVPAGADPDQDPRGPDAMPGIPTEGEPPTSG